MEENQLDRSSSPKILFKHRTGKKTPSQVNMDILNWLSPWAIATGFRTWCHPTFEPGNHQEDLPAHVLVRSEQASTSPDKTISHWKLTRYILKSSVSMN